MLLRLIKPYLRIKLEYLAEQLRVEKLEIVRLLIEIIHDNCHQLRIDQVNEIVIRIGHNEDLLEIESAIAMNKVCNELEALTTSMVNKCQ